MSETKQNVWYPVSMEPPSILDVNGSRLSKSLLIWVEVSENFTSGVWHKMPDQPGRFFSITANVRYPITHWMEVGNPNEQELPISDLVIEPTKPESPELIKAQKEIAVALVEFMKDVIALAK